METATIITLVFSGLVALSTIVYAILTWKLVKETKQMRISQYEPYIMFYLSTVETTNNYFLINIMNIGKGVAKNVKFEILTDPKFNSSRMTDNSFFQMGVNYFPPQKSYRYCLGSWQGMEREEILSRKLEIKVSYKDIFDKEKAETFSLSFSDTEIDVKFTPPETYIGMISHNIEKVNNSIKQLETTIKKITTEN